MCLRLTCKFVVGRNQDLYNMKGKLELLRLQNSASCDSKSGVFMKEQTVEKQGLEAVGKEGVCLEVGGGGVEIPQSSKGEKEVKSSEKKTRHFIHIISSLQLLIIYN